MPEFADAKVEDYELRGDGKVVRKDRWEMGIRNIASILGLLKNREFEIQDVVNAVAALELAANPEYVCINPECAFQGMPSAFRSHETGLVCPVCSEPAEKLKLTGAPA